MDELINQLQVVSEEQRDINNKISLAIASEQSRLSELQDRDKELRLKLLEAMEANNVRDFANDVLRIKYVAPQIRTTFDSTRFKEEAPEIYSEFTKEVEVKAHLKISVYERN